MLFFSCLFQSLFLFFEVVLRFEFSHFEINLRKLAILWLIWYWVIQSLHLDGSYTVFGEVIKGIEVVNAIQQVDTDNNDRPIEDVRILNVVIK